MSKLLGQFETKNFHKFLRHNWDKKAIILCKIVKKIFETNWDQILFTKLEQKTNKYRRKKMWIGKILRQNRDKYTIV